MINNYLKLFWLVCFCLPSIIHANDELKCSVNKFKNWELVPASPRNEDLLDRILTIGGISQQYTICEIPKLKAAGAILLEKEKRIIIYNREYLQKWARLSGEYYWGTIAIMAHEIGHHVLNHTARNAGLSLEKRRRNELEADNFAGYVLAKMGASLNNTQALMKAMSTQINDSKHTHPIGKKRVSAITLGWNKACKELGKRCHKLGNKATKNLANNLVKNASPEYETAGYQTMIALSDSFKGKFITKDYCKAYANIAVLQASKAKQAECGFNVDKSVLNNVWSVYWKPQYNWCMKASAVASGGDVLFRETKLKECKPFQRKPGENERMSCIRNDAFHKAAARGNIEFVRSCLVAGVDPNITERHNWTPLHSAASKGYLNIVKLLIQRGANVNVRDVNRRTPLDYANIGRHLVVATYLKHKGGVARN